MPEILAKFLEQLTPSDADDLSTWLDSTPSAVNDMIELVWQSQPQKVTEEW